LAFALLFLSKIMSNWNWLQEFNDKAWEDRDIARLQLVDHLFRGEGISHELPDEKYAAFEQGRIHAAQLGEKWWVMVFEFWKIQTLLYKKQDPAAALKLAAQCVVETRKPIYDKFPQKAVIHLDMVACYIRIDPIGYQAQIVSALAEVEKSCGPDSEDYRYFSQVKTRFLWAIESPDSVKAAWDYLRMAEEDDSDHHAVFALTYLCGTLYDYDIEAAKALIGDLSIYGITIAKSEKRERLEINFWMWKAVARLYDELSSADDNVGAINRGEARKIYDYAWRQNSRLAVPRNSIFGAAKAFHEVNGDFENALRICQHAIRSIHGHNLDFETASWRWKKLELLQKLERETAREEKRLRKVAGRLKSKDYWEGKISSLGY
jgi:hypothetical protein